MPQKILIVGLGNMGCSLVKGLLKSVEKHPGYFDITVFDQHQEKRSLFKNDRRLEVIDELSSVNISIDCVVLCVKPHDIDSVATAVSPLVGEKTILVSILAGTKIQKIAGIFEHSGPVVRAMPNIAATVGCAATVMTANDISNQADKDLVERVFSVVGECYWSQEKLMDVVTGLSGSGPAYIYMVIEALTDGGVKMGMPRDLAMNLATQTVLGAATLVKESGEHPAVLKDQVSTPAGTTISALVELESHGLRSMFVSAVVAATERSKFLGNIESED